MTVPARLRNIGDQVIVLDPSGGYLARGAIVGVHRIDPPVYDVQQRNDLAMSKRLCGIPESRIRSVAKPCLAYERQPPGDPRHIRDLA